MSGTLLPDDRVLWDLHVSGFVFPSLIAADEFAVFDALAKSPGTPQQLADQLQLNVRAVRALLPVLASVGLLVQRRGRYDLSDIARTYLLRDSPYYWGPVLALMRQIPISHANVVAALKAPAAAARWDAVPPGNPSDGWSEGRISLETAQAITAYMNACCLLASGVAAGRVDLTRSSRLLDVGAGSGCFSIAFAQANPHLHCTLMDLAGMDAAAKPYIDAAGLGDRIDYCTRDMLRQAWPSGYDAIFLSNIFHDWDFETCALLAAKAFEALPPGGRILLHEMLLDDTHDGPPIAAAFSVFMLVGTKGQQFTGAELAEILVEAGFATVGVIPSHGHFAVVTAEKP